MTYKLVLSLFLLSIQSASFAMEIVDAAFAMTILETQGMPKNTQRQKSKKTKVAPKPRPKRNKRERAVQPMLVTTTTPFAQKAQPKNIRPRSASTETLDNAQALLTFAAVREKRHKPVAPDFELINKTQHCKKQLCKMPDAASLQERLSKYHYVLEHTELIACLASKERTSVEVARIVFECLEEYYDFIEEQGWSEIAIEGQIVRNKDIVPLLLADYPQELTRLTLHGLYPPQDE